MQIYQEQVQSKTPGNVPVTVMKLVGDLDGSSYRQVIATAEQACAAGTNNLLLDLSEVGFMSSAGMVALHSIAMLMRKEQLPNLEEGWSALNAMQEYADSGQPEKHFKLLNPQPRVQKSLAQVGFDHIFEIFTDRETALAAFG